MKTLWARSRPNELGRLPPVVALDSVFRVKMTSAGTGAGPYEKSYTGERGEPPSIAYNVVCEGRTQMLALPEPLKAILLTCQQPLNIAAMQHKYQRGGSTDKERIGGCEIATCQGDQGHDNHHSSSGK